jgi:hypothetical protein
VHAPSEKAVGRRNAVCGTLKNRRASESPYFSFNQKEATSMYSIVKAFNNRKAVHACISATLLVALCSCEALPRYVVRSTPVDVPGLTQKGQSQVLVGAGASAGGEGLSNGQTGFDIRGAYALSSKWSVTAGFSSRTGMDEGANEDEYLFGPNPYPNDTASVRYRNYNWNGGTVFMQPLFGRLYFMGATGGGTGQYNFQDQGVFQNTAYSSPFHSFFWDAYLQAGLYLKTRHVEGGVGLRYTWYRYTSVSDNYSPQQAQAFTVNGLKGTTIDMAQLYYDMHIYVFRRIAHIDVQISLNGDGGENHINYHGYGFSGLIGLGLDLDRLFKLNR